MKILGVIPARGGSKGVYKKNIKLLHEKPLIGYTIEAALLSNLTKVVVSTDCFEIADVCKNYDVEVLIRSKELASDETPTLPVIQSVVNQVGNDFEAVMTLQPTSPFRTHKHIDESITLFERDKHADSLVSVVEVPHNFSPDKIMVQSGSYVLGSNNIKRRQDVDVMYARNGAAIYITRISKLSDYIFGGNILPYKMSKLHSFDIDDLEDWEIAHKIMKSVLSDNY